MNPQQYCLTKVAPPQSNLYYSTRFIAAEQRDALIALFALFSEVSEIINECQDTHVARIKYEWWQDEIQHLFAGNPHHPISHVLLEPLQRYQLSQQDLTDLIQHLTQDCQVHRYANADDLQRYCQQTGGILQRLCATVLGAKQSHAVQLAEQLGTAGRLMQLLENVRQDALQGRVYLPQADLAACGVTESMLLNLQANQSLTALFAQQTQHIRALYQNVLSQFDKAERQVQRPLWLLAQLNLATLRELELDGYQLFKHRVELTPLRKLWLVWWYW